MNAKARGDLSGLFDDLPEPGPAGTPGTPVRGPRSPAHPVRPYVNAFLLVLLVVVITAAGTAGEAVFGHVPGMKTWLTVGVITAIVVYAAGMLSRSRAARGKRRSATTAMESDCRGWPLPARHRERPMLLADMSERIDGLDHETARWTGRAVGGFIQGGSFPQSATLIEPAWGWCDGEGSRGRVESGSVAVVTGIGT